MSHSDPDARPQLFERLRGIKAQSAGRWVACCPAHEDRTPSLSIQIVDDGKVLLHCHAGCTLDAVLRAMGLTLRDLLPPTNRRSGRTHGASAGRARSYATVEDAVAGLARSLLGWNVTATWLYANNRKLPIFAIARFDCHDKKTYKIGRAHV